MIIAVENPWCEGGYPSSKATEAQKNSIRALLRRIDGIVLFRYVSGQGWEHAREIRAAIDAAGGLDSYSRKTAAQLHASLRVFADSAM